ncbi:MAG: CotH kinase family protein [Bryobacterales bacterium]|nr:CotH kinase family protein [Bryobacterales bacterium]
MSPISIARRGLAALFLTLVTAAAQNTSTDPAAAFFDDSQVREIRLYFEDPGWYNTLLRAHQTAEDPYFPCRFKSGDVDLPQIGCRFKGNSSAQRNGIKKPFKLDFNEYVDDATFMGLKKLNLNNFDLQPDFLREKLLHDMAGKYVAALRSVYVRLYVDDAFYGLYLAVEQPDKTMMQSRWGSSEDGNLYEAEEQMRATSHPTLAWLGSSQSAYENVYLLKTNETANDYSRLINFLDILNNSPAEEFPTKFEAIADIENWLTGMAANNLVVNLDSYLGTGGEYYLYDRTLDGRFVHIQWDNNETFGITGDGTPRLATPATTDPFWLPTTTTGPGGGPLGPGAGGNNAANNARPLLTKLWAVPEFRRVYLRALARFLREGGFNPEAMTARTTQLANLIREHVVADPNKAYTTAQFETAINTTVGTIPGVNQFVQARYTYMRNYLNNQASTADLRINEIAATDANPWIEIHNPGPGPVSLSGIYLTDDSAQPTKFALPADVTLADGAFLQVNPNFAIPAAGAKLYLFGSSSTALDTATIAATLPGQSQIRLGLYGNHWDTTTTPTPNAANTLTKSTPTSTGTLVINEIMADNDTIFADPDEPGAYEDWFEIYNPTTEAIDMSGMYITDNPNNPTKWQVGAGVVIPAGGYLVFMADSEPAQGPRHASWSLSADGESLSIYAKDGTTLIDTVTFGAQTTDVSIGRNPNGTGDFVPMSAATPGAPNSTPRQ